MNRLRRFMINGILMAMVTIVMRSVAVTFNVYISNKIGAVAMGLFTLISTVYGFGITFATSGINLATTRLVAQAIGDTASGKAHCVPEEKRGKVNCILRRCIVYSLLFGAAATIILWICAEGIGVRILGDARTVSSLKVLSITFVPIAVSSVMCGYFSAIRHVYKNAVIQIFGQGIKIFGCMAFIAALGANDTESACLAVVCGGTVAEIFSFLISLALYLISKKKSKQELTQNEKRSSTRELLRNALPLAFSAYMRSALVTIEHILIPHGLEKSGSSRDMSLAAYGIIGSMVFPLVLFPSAITASFAGLLIPEVAESSATNDNKRICGIISSVLETVLIFSIGCAGIIMCFSIDIGNTVYPEAHNAGKYILMISPLIPVMYLDTAVDSMLKGLGEQVYSMGVNIADALISVILVAILLPMLGINGYIITVYFTELLNAALSITRLLMKSKVKVPIIRWVARPLLCVILATKLTRLLISNTAINSNVWGHVALSALIYVVIMVITGGIKLKRIYKSVKYMIETK